MLGTPKKGPPLSGGLVGGKFGGIDLGSRLVLFLSAVEFEDAVVDTASVDRVGSSACVRDFRASRHERAQCSDSSPGTSQRAGKRLLLLDELPHVLGVGNKAMRKRLMFSLGASFFVGLALHAQDLPAVQNASGMRLLVASENTYPTLRVVLPGRPDSDKPI